MSTFVLPEVVFVVSLLFLFDEEGKGLLHFLLLLLGLAGWLHFFEDVGDDDEEDVEGEQDDGCHDAEVADDAEDDYKKWWLQ